MTLIEIFSILTIHYIGDFILQTDQQAKEKSKYFHSLIAHTLTYSVFVFFGIAILHGATVGTGEANFWFAFFFTIISFVTHTMTDYYTSRLNAYLWSKGDSHNFFVSVGGDQLLHYIQLFLTYQLLK